MGSFVGRVQALALAMGAPGLCLVAFLDSSFLSLPEIADFLVIWMVTQHKARFAWYAASATLGSVVGCLALYYVGRKGGNALIRRRFSSVTINRTQSAFQRYGVLAVLIPSLLPPPAPFKVFILLAGLANIGAGRLTVTLIIGRGSRYFGESLLALRYGDQTMTFIHEHALGVTLAVFGFLLAGSVAYVVWSRTARRS